MKFRKESSKDQDEDFHFLFSFYKKVETNKNVALIFFNFALEAKGFMRAEVANGFGKQVHLQPSCRTDSFGTARFENVYNVTMEKKTQL